MRSPVRVSAIVVHYRAEDYLRRCLNALLAMERKIPLEVIAVDNASFADPRGWEREYRLVRWIFMTGNRGFGAAANEGAHSAQGEFLLVLNSDAWPVDDGLARMVDFLDATPDVAVVNPQLLSPTGEQQAVLGGSAPTLGRMLVAKFSHAISRPAGPGVGLKESGAIELEWPSGAVMLCRRRAWDDVGGFDEGFFLYFEDCDLGIRLRKKGWRLALLPAARAVHVGGASFATDNSARHRAYREGQLLYFRKHRPAVEQFLVRLLR